MSYIVIIAAIISFAVTVVSGKFLIPFLKKLKYGQTILEIGPNWHKSKEGTPTMGGLMFILGIVVASVVGFILLTVTEKGYKTEYTRFIAGLIMALGFAALGFLDDYVKVVKKRNLGLTASQKMVGQIIIAVVYLLIVFFGGDSNTSVWFPFLGSLDFGILYYPFAVVMIVGFVNAVNLTDGIDGLASSVTFVAALGFMAVTTILRASSMSVLAAALACGCLGFLIYNFHPAKVFMGDTGSMFLGGLVVALAFGVHQPLLLFLFGIIYLIETGSVMLQVTYFKLTHGKRIFKMSPIHHHFEMCGWNEEKIVFTFSAVTFVFSIIAVVAILNLVN
ncbi:MAG: phospho-N-acetylmuramoyl-pentapeptide-transferase [Oscillospiraceae bacterium]|nr:phospho-N-acetylmuramoyl-pentapeptide-transferase [Oscillospiraceae bacterium]